MKIFNQTKKTVIAAKAQIADTFLSRMTGLLNKNELKPDEALIITRCQQIHMFFMRFSIDAIFVDKQNKVVGLVHDIKPFCMSKIFFRASFVIEMPPGVIAKTQTQTGDHIEIIKPG